MTDPAEYYPEEHREFLRLFWALYPEYYPEGAPSSYYKITYPDGTDGGFTSTTEEAAEQMRRYGYGMDLMDQKEGHQRLMGAMQGVHEDLSIQEAEYAYREAEYDEQYDYDEQFDEMVEASGEPRLQGYIDLDRTPDEQYEYEQLSRISQSWETGNERLYIATFNSTGNRVIVWLTPTALNVAKRKWKIRPATDEDRFVMGMEQWNPPDDTIVEVRYPNANEARRQEYRSFGNPGSQQRRDRGQGRAHGVDPRPRRRGNPPSDYGG